MAAAQAPFLSVIASSLAQVVSRSTNERLHDKANDALESLSAFQSNHADQAWSTLGSLQLRDAASSSRSVSREEDDGLDLEEIRESLPSVPGEADDPTTPDSSSLASRLEDALDAIFRTMVPKSRPKFEHSRCSNPNRLVSEPHHDEHLVDSSGPEPSNQSQDLRGQFQISPDGVSNPASPIIDVPLTPAVSAISDVSMSPELTPDIASLEPTMFDIILPHHYQTTRTSAAPYDDDDLESNSSISSDESTPDSMELESDEPSSGALQLNQNELDSDMGDPIRLHDFNSDSEWVSEHRLTAPQPNKLPPHSPHATSSYPSPMPPLYDSPQGSLLSSQPHTMNSASTSDLSCSPFTLFQYRSLSLNRQPNGVSQRPSGRDNDYAYTTQYDMPMAKSYSIAPASVSSPPQCQSRSTMNFTSDPVARAPFSPEASYPSAAHGSPPDFFGRALQDVPPDDGYADLESDFDEALW